MDCENCGNADMSFSADWLGHHVCYECNQRGFGLASDYRAKHRGTLDAAGPDGRQEEEVKMTLEELEDQVARTQGRGDGSGSIPMCLFLSLREGTDEAWDWANLAPTPGVSRRDALKLELGDLLNVITAIVMHAGFTLEEVAKANDEKLRQRWPDGHPCLACELEGACKMLVARAERAERERDEARAQAVWAAPISSGWIAWCPGGRVFGEAGWGDVYMAFPTEAEALAAGRAVPWWEVKA